MIFQTVLNSYIATIDVPAHCISVTDRLSLLLTQIKKKKLIATLSLNFIMFDNNLIIGISGFETDTYTKCMMSFICMGTKPT